MTIETPARQSALPFLHNIQALRGIAAMMVLLSHLYVIETKSTRAPILTDLWSGGLYGVDLFFVISGFIMVYVTRPLTGKSGPKVGGFLYARITRIYPLYWLISAALLAVYLWRPDMVFGSASAEPDVLKSFALWPDIREPLLAVGWTLVHEMGFYLVFALSLLLARKWLGLYLVIWGVAVLAGYSAGLQNVSPEFALMFHPLTFEFLAGAFIALSFERRPLGQTSRKRPALYGGLAALGLALVFLLPRYSGVDLTQADAGPRVMHMILPCALTVWALAKLDFSNVRPPVFMSRLGDWSYALYLSHVLTLSVISKVWIMTGWSGALVSAFMLSIMVVAAVLVAAVLHYGFERPVLALTRRIKPLSRR